MKKENVVLSFSNEGNAEVIQLNRVIIVDDDADFSDSLSEVLETKNYLTRTASNQLEALEVTRKFNPQVAILDIRIGNSNGVELISDLREISPDILCIMLTGYADMETVVEALREDAFDYLTKPIHPREVVSKLKRGFEKLELESQQINTVKALQISEKRYRTIIDNMVDGVIVLNKKGKIISFNHAATVIFGYDSKDIAGKSINTLLKINYDLQDDFLASRTIPLGSMPVNHEIDAYRNNNEIFPLRFSISELPIGDSLEKHLIFSCFDVSTQKRQENKLRQSQKMDALGKLSSGVAHDYNNMLGVITGYAELLKKELSGQDELSRYVNEIIRAGKRSAKLTKKLLNFSQKKPYEANVIDLNALVYDQYDMLNKMLTVRIDLILEPAKELWPILVDGSDIEDAILNISINAMHAIEGNGQLIIKTCNKKINMLDAQTLNLVAGDYVALHIKDTGCGMIPSVREKIFDPFYSTKGDGGTGLGLSQVYGFIARSKGAIKVCSELKKGTEFILYFPRQIEIEHKNIASKSQSTANTRGDENILIVDDEPALRELNCEILRQQGYNVFQAENGERALEALERESIDLLFSDIIMPGMNGFELTNIVKEKFPNIKIQLSSGFSGDQHANKIDKKIRDNMLQKPIASRVLLEKIRKLLNE